MIATRYIYFSDNVQQMASFYVEILGMKQIKTSKTPQDPNGWVQLKSGGMEIAIHRAGRPGMSGRNRNKLVYVAKDVAEAHKELKMKGVRVGKLQVGEEFARFEFKDPDGNLIQVANR